MPFPGTRVIHRDWQTRHRPVAKGTMTVGVKVTRAGTGEGTYNPATGQTDPPARTTVTASTQARIQARAASDRVVQTGDQTITFRGYLVTLPVDVGDIRVDDRVEVITVAAADDPQLLGLVLRVIDVMYGSLVWERDLICEDDLG